MRFLLVLLISLPVFAQNLTDEVAKTAQLRQEVELLSHEVEALKKSQQAQMDVYIARYQEITSSILKEQFRRDQLKDQIKLSKEKLEKHSKNILSKTSENWLKEFWTKYEASLKLANPLLSNKLSERISKLRVDLQFKKISYEHALLQTWFVLETDLNRSQDAEFILTPLQADNKLYHVEMVRLGRTKGYFRTAQGQYGLFKNTGNWSMEFFNDASSKAMVETLLSQFKQQQKTGEYQLPGVRL